MIPYWNSMARHGWVEAIPDGAVPPGFVDEEARLEARAELDIIVARDVFGLTGEEMGYVLECFPIVKRREEQLYREYRTRRLVLEAWDRLGFEPRNRDGR